MKRIIYNISIKKEEMIKKLNKTEVKTKYFMINMKIINNF